MYRLLLLNSLSVSHSEIKSISGRDKKKDIKTKQKANIDFYSA